MTCIVGITDGKGGVFMGADSAVSGGDQRTTLAHGKVWAKGPMIFGACGSLRHGQLLRYRLAIPKREHGQDVMEYLSVQFGDAVRTALRDGGALEKYYGVEHSSVWALVGYAGRLFHVEADGCVVESTRDYEASGSGEEYAYGSLFATAKSKLSIRERLRSALEAASEFSGSVAPPFEFISNRNKETDL